jgi:hypothetical protein
MKRVILFRSRNPAAIISSLCLKASICLLPVIAGMTAPPARAQGMLMISNTNQPNDGVIGATYATRAVFRPGFDAGGYELTGFSIALGDNSGASHGPAHVFLFGSNDPFNLDADLSDFYVNLPGAPGFYYLAWPTNYYIPPQFSYSGDYYYHIVIVPASGDYLYVDYTTNSTETNYLYNNAWTFYPGASDINGWNGYYSLVNIYATVLPPPVLYPIRLRDEAVLPDDSFQFGFTNSPGFSFSVYITTNLALPFTNWIYGGTADNIASNYFQFNTGPGVVHNPAYPSNIFFHVTSP